MDYGPNIAMMVITFYVIVHTIGFIRWRLRSPGQVLFDTVKVLAQEPLDGSDIRRKVGVSLIETPHFMLFLGDLAFDGYIEYGTVLKGRRERNMYYATSAGYKVVWA